MTRPLELINNFLRVSLYVPIVKGNKLPGVLSPRVFIALGDTVDVFTVHTGTVLPVRYVSTIVQVIFLFAMN